MKKAVTFGSVLLCAAVLSAQAPPPQAPPRMMHGGWGGGEFGLRGAGPGSRTPVTGAPYSAVETTQFVQSLAGGNQISKTETSKVYRDSQGRVRMEHSVTGAPGSAPRTVISIFDPVAGVSHVLDPSTNTAVRMPVHTAHAEQASQPARSRAMARPGMDVQKENLGIQVINGISATGTRTTETIAAGTVGNAQAMQVVREVWVSNDLKVPLLIKSSDPRFGNTTMQLSNVVQSEPDAALFQVPATYTETTRGPGAPRSLHRGGPQN